MKLYVSLKYYDCFTRMSSSVMQWSQLIFLYCCSTSCKIKLVCQYCIQAHYISTTHVWANLWFAVYHPGNVLKMKDCPSREIKHWCMKNGSLWAIHNSFQAINAVTNRGNNSSWATHKPFWIAYQQNCFASGVPPPPTPFFFSCWERRVIGLTGKQWYQVAEGEFSSLIISCIFF